MHPGKPIIKLTECSVKVTQDPVIYNFICMLGKTGCSSNGEILHGGDVTTAIKLPVALQTFPLCFLLKKVFLNTKTNGWFH